MLAHPCSAIGGCERHCNIFGTIQHVPKVPLAEHHDMIEAIPPDRADESPMEFLRMCILPWCSRCDRTILMPMKPPDENISIEPDDRVFMRS
jgi:hypothetical protein